MKKFFAVVALALVVLVMGSLALAESRTQQEALSWANSRLSEAWAQDYDGINGCQDVDLIKYYYSWLGASRVYGYGYVYVNCSLPTGWTRSSTPMQGDIAVWGANVGGAGQYGHVGIVTKVSGSYITYIATNDGAIQCTEHTVSRYNPSTFIHPAFVSYASLDINWRIDGKDENSSQNAGTVDVYINGAKVADDVDDYYVQHVKGSTYEIKDIKPKSGYQYAGVVSGNLSGTLSGDTAVRIGFDKYVAPVISGASVIITGTDVPVRSAPNTGGYQLGTALKESVFQYLGNSATDSRGVVWYNISYYSQSGWVSSRLSTLKDDPSGFSSGDTVNVVSGNTNIRSLPSLSGKILGVGYKGSSFTYLGQSAVDERGITWYKISYKSSSAWISSKYTELVQKGSDPWDDWGGWTPSVAYISQSAYLTNNNPVVDGSKAFDGDTATCWCVSEYNYSFGQWVEIGYTSQRSVNGFTIYNGYNKTRGSNDYWKLNSRVSSIAVYCDGAYIGMYTLSDVRTAQTISFSWPVSGSTFKFVIRGAYPGTKYADVCISEIILN